MNENKYQELTREFLQKRQSGLGWFDYTCRTSSTPSVCDRCKNVYTQFPGKFGPSSFHCAKCDNEFTAWVAEHRRRNPQWAAEQDSRRVNAGRMINFGGFEGPPEKKKKGFWDEFFS